MYGTLLRSSENKQLCFLGLITTVFILIISQNRIIRIESLLLVIKESRNQNALIY